MNTEIQVYRDLQKHLDRLPIGFPMTESGVEIRILKYLFTPEEARIATQLSMIPEPVSRIHKRVKKNGMSIETLQQLLEQMVQKGTILLFEEGAEKRYSNALFAVGMYEFQVDRMTKDFASDFLQYLDEGFAEEAAKTRINQLRTIPVEKSVPTPEIYLVSDYDKVKKLVESAPGPVAVANCVCRQSKDLVGQSCTKTDLRETCLMISPYTVEYYNSVGIGHIITKDEALDILEKAQKAGLVLQPQNSQHPEFICCCCGDCCGILISLKKFPRPADYYATNYYAVVDPELCTGCQICVERCQMDASSMVNGVAVIDLDRCIGCGNCVVLCDEGAVQLQNKEETIPPKDTEALYKKILYKKVGKLKMLGIGAKMLLKQKV